MEDAASITASITLGEWQGDTCFNREATSVSQSEHVNNQQHDVEQNIIR